MNDDNTSTNGYPASFALNTLMTDYTLTNLDYHASSFNSDFKQYIEQLPPASLPLHNCTSQGGIVDDTNISASILTVEAIENGLEIKIAVFFTEIIGGCSCGDDPVSANAYGELLAIIDTVSNNLTFTVIND